MDDILLSLAEISVLTPPLGALCLFFRKGRRRVLQKGLNYEQPGGRTGDWGAGDRPSAEFQHLFVYHRQHGSLIL